MKSLTHTDSRRAASAAGARVATLPGVTEIRRTFPATDAPEAAPFDVVRDWTFGEFVPRVAGRLDRLATGLAASEMLDSVLRCWDLRGAAGK
jgi:hypothetical protein